MADNKTSWDVRIKFEDGVYQVRAWAETKERALKLALIDARMASPFGSFMSAVQSWEATPV